MKATLIGIKDNRGNHEAQEKRPYHGGQGPCRPSTKPHHVDARNPVSDAVAERTDEKYLFHRKDCKRCPLVATEGKVADRQGNDPVDADREDAAAGPGDGAGTGLRQPEPLSRVLGDSGRIRPCEP